MNLVYRNTIGIFKTSRVTKKRISYDSEYTYKIVELLKEAHDKMDDFNAGNNSGLENGVGGTGRDERFCTWCQSWPPRLIGYDAQGLKHEDDCILVKIRKVVDC